MLGVFRRDEHKEDQSALQLPGPEYIPALRDDYLKKHFTSVYSCSKIVDLGSGGFLAYSDDEPGPRIKFEEKDGVYCMYRGETVVLDVDRVIETYMAVKVMYYNYSQHLRNLPLYHCLDSEGSYVVSDNIEIMNKICGSLFRVVPGDPEELLIIPALIEPISEGLPVPLLPVPVEEPTESGGSS